jgi:hypothetical protein
VSKLILETIKIAEDDSPFLKLFGKPFAPQK